MNQIADLVEQLRSMKSNSCSPRQVTQYIEERTKEGMDLEFYGDPGALIEFVSFFEYGVQGEGHKDSGLQRERIRAIELGKQRLLEPLRNTDGHSLGAFRQINPIRFSFQFFIRLREPKFINQGWTGLCGTSAQVVQLAKRRPYEYAELVIGLFWMGEAVFNRVLVKPCLELRNGYNPEMIGECDYVTLGSIRNSPAILYDLPASSVIPGGTGDASISPSEICRWLRRAGYKCVEDHSFNIESTPESWEAAKQSLKDMAHKLSTGHSVLMFGHHDVTMRLAFNRPLPPPRRSRPLKVDHCVFVTSFRMSRDYDYVEEFKIFSWGDSFQLSKIGGAFSTKELAERFAGFISCRGF